MRGVGRHLGPRLAVLRRDPESSRRQPGLQSVAPVGALTAAAFLGTQNRSLHRRLCPET